MFFIGSHTGGQVTARWQVPKIGTRVMHLDIDAAEIGRNYPTEHALLGDAKTVLQERAARLGHGAPRYDVDSSGPDHAKHFVATVTVGGVSASGEGPSKKVAEQQGLTLLELFPLPAQP